MNLVKTDFCWSCGLPCKELFCNDKCKKRYEANQAKQQRKEFKIGKREGYGVTGSTH